MNPLADAGELAFRPLEWADLSTLHDWLRRPHVAQWWGAAPSRAEVEIDFEPMSSTRWVQPHGGSGQSEALMQWGSVGLS